MLLVGKQALTLLPKPHVPLGVAGNGADLYKSVTSVTSEHARCDSLVIGEYQAV
jgi:hypothetical protein